MKKEDFEIGKKMQHIDSQLFRDIEDAMMFVNSAGYGENSAIWDKTTGKIYYQSAFEDFGEYEKFEEDKYDPDIHIGIPHKNFFSRLLHIIPDCRMCGNYSDIGCPQFQDSHSG